MTHEELLEMVKEDVETIRFMRTMMEEHKQDFHPMLVLVLKDGSKVARTVEWENNDQKHMAMLAAGFAARQTFGDIKAFAFIAEAWYLHLEKEEKERMEAAGEQIPLPSESADKREGMFISYINTETREFISAMIPITRDEEGKVLLGEEEIQEEPDVMESHLFDSFFKGYNYVKGVSL